MQRGFAVRNLVQKRTMMGLPEHGVAGKQLIEHQEAIQHHAKDAAEMWKKVFIFTGIPILAAAGANTFMLEKAHHEHLEHHPPHYKQLAHLHQRKKPFPWGDGNKSFFYNAHVQPLPEQ